MEIDEVAAPAFRGDKCRKYSLQTKIWVFMIGVLLVFGVFSVAISYRLYLENSVEQHKHLAIGVANLAAKSIDANYVDNYIALGEKAPGYLVTRHKLEIIRSSYPDIKFLYVYKIMEDGCHVVFDLDTKDSQASSPGEIVQFDESFHKYVPALLNGKNIEPVISDDTYGWLLTVYVPVYNDDGAVKCYVGTDVSMDGIRQQANNFIMKATILSLALFLLVLGAGFVLVKYHLVNPINKMAKATANFALNSDESMERGLAEVRSLNIKTGDEVENLYSAFLKMTEDGVQFMKDIRRKNEVIEKMQNALIVTLADIVESRDENTGQHIKKTAAYVRIILEEMKRQGIYSDVLTDEYIEKVVNSAPLHDIGKVAVPDGILNKPGKLTDEEFAAMKLHTSEGGKIIADIMEKVPESNHLDEAKNLAVYHHERWTGGGYPTGIAGENIPLSARVMAVADVFDALVSKRSYKQGFPMEKALAIIEEESGTHFDPQVTKAFFAAKEKILAVANKFQAET